MIRVLTVDEHTCFANSQCGRSQIWKRLTLLVVSSRGADELLSLQATSKVRSEEARKHVGCSVCGAFGNKARVQTCPHLGLTCTAVATRKHQERTWGAVCMPVRDSLYLLDRGHLGVIKGIWRSYSGSSRCTCQFSFTLAAPRKISFRDLSDR